MKTFKKTKIIATIGPASESKDIMQQLIESGVNVFRFNMKHGTNNWHQDKIMQAKFISAKLNNPVGILVDLQGPEIRTKIAHEKIELDIGEEFVLTHNDNYLNEDGKVVHVSTNQLLASLEPGDTFAIDDGKCLFEVVKKAHDFLICKSADYCLLFNNKSLNVIQKDVQLPCLTQKDMDRLNLISKLDVDFVALSYVRSKSDILELREHMKMRRIKAQVVAKIESQKGINNIDEIIKESDAVMIARGDLGIETPIEKVTYFQKETIKKCRANIKNAIVATQMMESMIERKIPTRAEAADVSNAVFDSADATMLSGETATGKYPVLTAQTMAKILMFNEGSSVIENIKINCDGIVRGIAKSVMNISEQEDINAIVAVTSTGYTAQLVSALRPKVPIIAVTTDQKVYKTLTLEYGIFPFLTEFPTGDIFSYDKIISDLKKAEILNKGDTIILAHGQRFGTPGKTNSLVVLEI